MANFNHQDSEWLKVCPKSTLDRVEAAMIDLAFDTQTDYDVETVKREMAAIKKLKRMCLVKLFTFLPEALFSNLFQSTQVNNSRRALNKVYFKFLFNKINYSQFKKELLIAAKDDIILI